MDKTQAFGIINQARLMMKSTTTSDKTIHDYERIYYLATNGRTTSPGKKIQDATSRSTANKMRAAARFCIGEDMRELLSIQAQMQRQNGQNESWLNYVKTLQVKISEYESISLMQPKTVLKRRSKRQDLKGLPQNWQKTLINEVQKKDRTAAILCAVTGCRPAELAKSVKVVVTESSVVVIIAGAKVTKTSGQPTRTLTYDIAPGLVQELSRKLGIGEHTVKIDDPRRFGTSVRDAGKRAFPDLRRTLTPYCLRHQVASDLKASKLSGSDVSKSLGHCTDKTATRYGHIKMGKGGVVPVSVVGSREVKQTAVANLDRVKPQPRQAEKILDPDFVELDEKQAVFSLRSNSP